MESAYANVVYVLWDNYPYAISEQSEQMAILWNGKMGRIYALMSFTTAVFL